ncbi:DNA helicase [Giardia lamblia P15]|uniref:DNA helicase n=1 Tax=Giardia intestinalis (strain P15) TaxID=658858 RepID=E1EX55_GIAIA|nr:DNA helicase [Giardia lamblia P15]
MLKAIDALVLTLSETSGVTLEPPSPIPYVPLQEVYTHWHPVFRQTPYDVDIFCQECFTDMDDYVQKLLARETELREDDEAKDTTAPTSLSLEQTTFGLPPEVIANLQIKDLLPWQSELLLKTVPLEIQRDEYVPPCYRHILISAPTSAGKSLVAFIYILRCLALCKKSAIVAVPFVALADELVGKLRDIIPPGCGVVGITGMKQVPRVSRSRPIIYVCTFEKAILVFSRFLQKGLVAHLGLLVFDEIHLIGDGSTRACKLELFISQLILLEKTARIQICYRIVGMSATLSNISDLQRWLGCYVYECNFRPISLQEYVLVDKNLYLFNTQTKRLEPRGQVLVNSPITKVKLNISPLNTISLIALKPLIIFVATKHETVNVANSLAEIIRTNFPSPPAELMAKRSQLIAELNQLGDVSWTPLISAGVMYHNSSLASLERTLIEEAFSNSVIHTLVATTTISAGVNLPARSVVIRYQKIGSIELDGAKYRQMIGRAGRMGLATSGHSFLLLTERDKKEVLAKLSSGSDIVAATEQLLSELHTIRPILSSLSKSSISAEVILNSCIYDVSVREFIESTLAHVQGSLKHENVVQTLEILQSLGLVLFSNGIVRLTPRGRACVDAGTDIYNSLVIYAYLQTFQTEGLLVGNDYHICCTIIPIYTSIIASLSDQLGENESKRDISPNQLFTIPFHFRETPLLTPKYETFYNVASQMDPAILHPTLAKLHLSMDMVEAKMLNSSGPCSVGMAAAYNGLVIYTFLTRVEGVQVPASLEKVFTEVRTLFGIDGGSFEALLKHSIQQSNAMAQFSDSLGRTTTAQVYRLLADRLRRITLDDLSDLLAIPGVGEKRARALRDAGYRSAWDIIEAGLDRLKQTVDFGPATEAACVVIYRGAEKLWDTTTNG